MYVPVVLALRDEILAHFHNHNEGGHSGWLWTHVRIKHFFIGKVSKNEVKKLVVECDICQNVKYDKRCPMELLQPLPIPKKIWEGLTMDFVEELPSSGDYESILVIVKKLSKGTPFIPLKHPFTTFSVSAYG